MSQHDDEMKEKEAKEASAAQAARQEEEKGKLNTSLEDQLPDFERLEKMREQLEKGPPAEETSPETTAQTTEAKPAHTETQPAATAEQAAAQPDGKTEAKSAIAQTSDEVERLRKELRSRDGKHGAELDGLRKQLSEATVQLEELRKAKVIETYAADPNADPTQDQLKKIYGDDYADQYGHDWAVRDFKAKLRMEHDLLGRVEKLVDDRLNSVRQQTSEDRLRNDLERMVPGATQLDQDADINGFGAFLQGDFKETGISRKEIAMRAKAEILNGASGLAYERAMSRLSAVFKDFTSSSSSETASTETTPKGSAPAKEKKDRGLYIQPTTSGADKVPSGAKFTHAQVKARLDKATPEELPKVMEWALEQAQLGNVLP